MNYTTIGEFGNKVCISLAKIMGSDYDLVFREVAKNNNVCLHSIMINKKGSNVAPSIYIDELYEDYIHGMEFSEIVNDILDVYIRNAKEINMDLNFFTYFDTAKERILYKLIHCERNTELLEDIPHLKWNDLAIVFYYLFEDERFGKATILIKNSHLAMWKIDCETLYKNARSNMPRLQPDDMIPIRQVIKDIMFDYNSSHMDLAADSLLQGYDAIMNGQGPVMYLLSSRDKYFGAAVILYSKALKRLSEKLDRNLIILPSSVHEVLLVPDDDVAEVGFYRDMVREVNDTQLEPEEILSYNVYYYDRFTEQITVMQG